MYAALSLPRPLMAATRLNPKMKEENGEHVGTSFFLLPLQCTIVYSTHNATSNLLLTRQKRASILPAEQKEIEFMCLREINIPGNLSHLIYCTQKYRTQEDLKSFCNYKGNQNLSRAANLCRANPYSQPDYFHQFATMDQHLVTLPSICNNLFDAFSNCYRK